MKSELDHRILAVLKKDARITITELALKIGAARATVQSRMERLIQDGTIQRFTIETAKVGQEKLIRAIMMIEIQGPQGRQVTKSLKQINEIVSLHNTNGNWDFVAELEVTSLIEFDRILRQVRDIKGVLNSETAILLSPASY
jgi:DNA-binding Lrp family transcriptional regulator